MKKPAEIIKKKKQIKKPSNQQTEEKHPNKELPEL